MLSASLNKKCLSLSSHSLRIFWLMTGEVFVCFLFVVNFKQILNSRLNSSCLGWNHSFKLKERKHCFRQVKMVLPNQYEYPTSWCMTLQTNGQSTRWRYITVCARPQRLAVVVWPPHERTSTCHLRFNGVRSQDTGAIYTIVDWKGFLQRILAPFITSEI